jgi:hypothetical protein
VHLGVFGNNQERIRKKIIAASRRGRGASIFLLTAVVLRPSGADHQQGQHREGNSELERPYIPELVGRQLRKYPCRSAPGFSIQASGFWCRLQGLGLGQYPSHIAQRLRV